MGRRSSTLTVDRGALRDARELIGLKLPVVVAVVGRRMLHQGWYRDVQDGAHRITVRVANILQGDDPPDATLWHELAHARQRESFPNYQAFNDEYLRQWHAAGLSGADSAAFTADEHRRFYTMPFEREALELEQRAIRHPLFVPHPVE